MNDIVEQRLEALTQRLQYVEDELAIRQLMARYGMAVDCDDVEAALACHSDDAVYIVSAPGAGRGDQHQEADLQLRGHPAIREMLSSPMHRSLLSGCAHTVGPATVAVNGDDARATGYSRLYHRNEDQCELLRVAVNEWHFCRRNNRWYIQSRESRLIGETAAKQLLRRGLIGV